MQQITTRHGVSPLIAAVLLIAFTMAVAAILTAWVTQFTQTQTGAVSNQSDTLINCAQGQLEVQDAVLDPSNNVTNVVVWNKGGVTFNNVSIVLLAPGQVVGQGYIPNLQQGSIKSESVDKFNPATDPNPSKVRVTSRSCPSVTHEKRVS